MMEDRLTAEAIGDALTVIQHSCVYGDNVVAYYILNKYIDELQDIIREHNGEEIKNDPDDVILTNEDIATAISVLREVSVEPLYQESLMLVMDYVLALQKIIENYV